MEPFTITEDKLDTGLRGFPVGYCSTSKVVPDEGLFYMEQPIHELAEKKPIDVIFLLYHGRFAEPDELTAFKEDLMQRATLHPSVKEHIYQLPTHGSAMSLFSCALMITGMIEGNNDYKEDALNLIAKVPEIAACVINHHASWGATPESKPELGYMENFTHLLQVPNKQEEALTEVFNLFDVLHFDHGGGNLSTFVGKAVSSGLEDMYGSMAGAMNALAGPRHGKANQDCLLFVKEIVQELGDDITEDKIEAFIRKRLDNNELIYGFGHAVLRVEDARASVLYQVAQEKHQHHPLIKTVLALREVGPKVLKENPKISNPYPNVDGVSGSVLAAAGFEYPDYFPVLFGLSRCVGIAIQIVHERLVARSGKGIPIYRPKYVYRRQR